MAGGCEAKLLQKWFEGAMLEGRKMESTAISDLLVDVPLSDPLIVGGQHSLSSGTHRRRG